MGVPIRVLLSPDIVKRVPGFPPSLVAYRLLFDGLNVISTSAGADNSIILA